MELTFVVPGIPVPQGSKMPWGAEANPHVMSWRESVARAATEAMANPLLELGPFPGPVAVRVAFCFPRPKAHYGSGRNAQVLKESAPRWHTSTPDLDKLQRALGDAMKGVVVRDDSQIAAWTVAKSYSTQPRAEISVREL